MMSCPVTWNTDESARAILKCYPGNESVTASGVEMAPWLNLAHSNITNDANYSFPQTVTSKMKEFEARYAGYLFKNFADEAKYQKLIQRGVTEWQQSKYREKLSEKMAGNTDLIYPADLLGLIDEYRLPLAIGGSITQC